MSGAPLYYRLRIRDAGNSTDALVITSVRGGTSPYLADAPTGDGQEFDPLTGQMRQGAYTGRIVDAITSGSSRVFTSQLEDATFRQQLMDRVGYYEWSTDGVTWPPASPTTAGVLCAGYVTGLRLISGIAWEVTVSDGLRAVDTAQAFAPKYDPNNPGHLEAISTYLARWPNRGCIFGGPVIGGFLGMQDYNGWEMEAYDQTATETFLKFDAGYGPPKFTRTKKGSDVADAVNQAVASLYNPTYLDEPTGIAAVDNADVGRWPGVVIDVAGHGYFQPTNGHSFPWIGGYTQEFRAHGFTPFFKSIKHGGLFIAGNTLPVSAARLRVRCYTARPSDLSPIYWTGHPVDLLTKLWDEQGFAYNSAAATTVKNALGTNKTLSLRITAPESLNTFLQDVLCGPFGIGVRMNDSGQLEPFVARIFANTTPSLTLGNADVQSPEAGAAPIVFELDEQTALRVVSFEQQLLVPTTVSGSLAVDGFGVQTKRDDFTSGDTGAIGNRTIKYRIPGMVHLDNTRRSGNAYVRAIAKEIFDRWGRGVIATELALLRGGAGDGLVLGQEVLVNLPQMPNHNYRLGDNNTIPARRMQVVRITPGPTGAVVKLLDSGPNAQPVATLPTLTLAASSDQPRTIAQITVTNAATLNAIPAGIRIQIATTTGAAPAASDYADLDAYQPGQIPTTAIRTLAVTAGRTVYVQARTEEPGAQPSNWSTPVSVALTALAPVTALTATPSGTDGSQATLAWTDASNGTLVAIDVAVRLSADPSTNDVWRARSLDGASTQYTLDGLTPGSTYTATVQVRDVATGDTVATTVTFTAGATTLTLPPPLAPTPFAGTQDGGVAQRDGVYGLAVMATDVPGLIEVQEAVETAVGSGTYGSYTTSTARVPSVQNWWTAWHAVAPNDGLHRQLQARHVRDGCTPSAWTAAVTVLPWTPLALPDPTPSLEITPTITSTQYSIAFTSTGTVQYKVGTGSYGAATSPVVVARNAAGGADQTVTFKATLNGIAVYQTITVPAQVAPTPSITGVTLTVHTAGSSFDVSWTANNAPTGATYTIDWKVTESGATGHVDGATNPDTITTTLTSTPHGYATVTMYDANGSVVATGRNTNSTMAL